MTLCVIQLKFWQGVADHLRELYEHPDFVELYPGLVAEEAKKPMVPGVGIAPTFTISRAVLSDAVALVRGDRFYTVSRFFFHNLMVVLIGSRSIITRKL